MEEFILDFVNFVGHLDFAVVLRIFLLLYAIFWFFIVVWVWFDAGDKSNKLLFRIFSVFIVLFFNVLGLIIYFLMRPAESYEERYWQELEKRYLEFETGGLMNCQKCGGDLRPDFLVCPSCGVKVKTQCENCNRSVNPKWKFCVYCGTKRNVEDVKYEKSEQNGKGKKDKKDLEKDLDVKEKKLKKPSRRNFQDMKKRFFVYLGGLKRRTDLRIERIKTFIREGDKDIEDDKEKEPKQGKKKKRKHNKKGKKE